jgi:putative Mn2+ efflux pump MntP
MDYFTIFILAFGLSFDSFAVSVTSGLNVPRIRFFEAVKMASVLAVFQGMMPVFGWLLGSSMKSLIAPVDHWIAFALLSLVGGKMMMESFTAHEDKKVKDPLRMRVILLLALATSIDALAVGFSFSIFLEKIFWAIFIIAGITFIASMTGILIGKKTGPRINQYAEIIGGLILIGIGCKVLLEHLFHG